MRRRLVAVVANCSLAVLFAAVAIVVGRVEDTIEAACWVALGAVFATLVHWSVARLSHRTGHIERRKESPDILYLKRSSAVLRTLLARQERDSEAERKRLSWEVHEGLGQTLMAMRIHLEALGARQADGPVSPELLAPSKELLDRSIRTVRELSASLRPRVLDFDIEASLDWLAEDFMRRTDIPCILDIDPSALSMDEDSRTIAFRIAQDALDNVARHAGAQTAEVILRRAPDCYFLRILDDGKGFDVNAARCSGLGLLRMRERARMLDGDVRLFSSPGKGTVVDVFLPDSTAVDSTSSMQEFLSPDIR